MRSAPRLVDEPAAPAPRFIERPFSDREIDDGVEQLPDQPRPSMRIDDAEEAVLSAMLMEVAAVAEVRALDLKAEDFSSPGRASVFRAMLALEERGSAIDPITLCAELNGSLEAAGGKDYISWLIDVVPTSVNVKHHAELVLTNAKGRALADRLEKDARSLRDGTAKADVIASRLGPALDTLGASERSNARPFPIVRVLEGSPLTPPTVQVTDLILGCDLNYWTGYGGSGKTVLLLSMAISVVLGLPVFGALAVHRPGPVLLVLPEDGQAAARMMLDAIGKGLALNEAQRAQLGELLVMVSDDADVKITTDTRRIAATVRDHGAVMVILDPLSNLLGGASEREEDTATPASSALRRDVCRGANATVVLSHHFRKPGKDFSGSEAETTVHDVRGSGAWINSSRLAFGVTKKQNRLTMKCLKSNRLDTDLRHELDLEIVGDPDNKAHWLTCRITDANVGASSDALTPGIGRALNTNERAVLGCLDDQHEPDKRLSWSTWRDDSGLNANTFKSVKNRLLDARLAAAIPTGRKTRSGGPEYVYQLTQPGRHALSSGWVEERSSGEGVRRGDERMLRGETPPSPPKGAGVSAAHPLKLSPLGEDWAPIDETQRAVLELEESA